MPVSKKSKGVEINGVQYAVAPLCQAQEDILLELFGEAGIVNTAIEMATGEEDKDIDFDGLLINMGRKRLIPRFLAVILVPVNQKFNEDRLPKLREIMSAESAELKFRVWPDFLAVGGKYLSKYINISPEMKETFGGLLQAKKPAKGSSSSPAGETSPNAN